MPVHEQYRPVASMSINKKHVIPALIVLMAFSLVGIILAQVYWINETFWLTQRRIDTEVVGIMESAIQKAEVEHTTSFVASRLGLDPAKPWSWSHKRDSLVRLKYLVDSMEMALAEAELNHKLGVTQVANWAPQLAAGKPAKAPMASSTPQLNAKAMAPHAAFGPDPDAPISSKQLAKAMAEPNYTIEAGPEISSNRGEYRSGEGRPSYVLNGTEGLEPGANIMSLNGRWITLPNGKRVQVKVEPYLKTRVDYSTDAGRISSIENYNAEQLRARGLLSGNEWQNNTWMPSLWVNNVDSAFQQQRKAFSFAYDGDQAYAEFPSGHQLRILKGRNLEIQRRGKRGNAHVFVSTGGDELASSTINLSVAEQQQALFRHEMAKLKSVNRRFVRDLSNSHRGLARFVDSVTKRQLELAFDAARIADSVAMITPRILAPEPVFANDVLQPCAPVAAPAPPTFTATEAPAPPAKTRKAPTQEKASDATSPSWGVGEFLGAVNSAPATRKNARHGKQQHNHQHATTCSSCPLVANDNLAVATSISRASSSAAANNLSSVSNALNHLIAECETQATTGLPFDVNLLKSALEAGFKEHGLDIPFEFAIVSSDREAPKATFASQGFELTKLGQAYKASIFPNSPGNNVFLSVYLPDKDSWALYNLKWSLFASVVFMLIIIGVFIAGIMTIIRQKRLSTIKSDFISNMTHELKTPLATISLAADTLNYHDINTSPERIKYFTGIIKDENQRMTGHIERVLQMALLDKDEQKLKRAELNLVEVVLEQGECLSLSVENKGGTLSVDFDEDEIPIFADKLQVQSILSNLVDNAIKYCERKPEINIRIWQDNGMAMLSVQDNGIGISTKLQRKIFDRFYRITQGDLHEVKGFGLGLSFVKAITEAHGGQVTVESTPKYGSKFTIALPLATTELHSA